MASIKVGAAWWKKDRNGEDYLSVSFDPACPVVINPGQRAALFPNPNKTQPNQPDYELVILPTRQADMEADDFSPEQQPRSLGAADAQRNSYAQPAQRQAPPPQYAAPEDFAPPPTRPMAPRSAAPAPRQPAPQRPPAPRATRQPAPPPDYDTSDLEDPFAE